LLKMKNMLWIITSDPLDAWTNMIKVDGNGFKTSKIIKVHVGLLLFLASSYPGLRGHMAWHCPFKDKTVYYNHIKINLSRYKFVFSFRFEMSIQSILCLSRNKINWTFKRKQSASFLYFHWIQLSNYHISFHLKLLIVLCLNKLYINS